MNWYKIPYRFFSTILVLFSCVAFAQPNTLLSPCKSQISKYCSEDDSKKDVRGLVKCLIKNDHSLSLECKQSIERFSKAKSQTTPPGASPLSALGGMGGLAARVPVLIYSGKYVPGDNVLNRDTSFKENSFKISIPFYKKGMDSYSFSLNGEEVSFGQKIELDSGLELPKQLYKTEIGLQYSHALEGRKMFGFQGSYGYTGDKFTSETQSYSINVNYSYPGSEEGHWVLLIFLSNNSPFGSGIPIPGFFYIYRSPHFTGVFGVPILSMQWTPIDLWSFSFSALGPILKTEVSYGAIDNSQFFTGFSWIQQRFILNDRESNEDRLTLEEKKLEIGVRRPIFKQAFAEFRTGRAFDRSLYIGNGLFDKKGGNANFAPNLFFSWNIRFVF